MALGCAGLRAHGASLLRGTDNSGRRRAPSGAGVGSPQAGRVERPSTSATRRRTTSGSSSASARSAVTTAHLERVVRVPRPSCDPAAHRVQVELDRVVGPAATASTSARSGEVSCRTAAGRLLGAWPSPRPGRRPARPGPAATGGGRADPPARHGAPPPRACAAATAVAATRRTTSGREPEPGQEPVGVAGGRRRAGHHLLGTRALGDRTATPESSALATPRRRSGRRRRRGARSARHGPSTTRRPARPAPAAYPAGGPSQRAMSTWTSSPSSSTRRSRGRICSGARPATARVAPYSSSRACAHSSRRSSRSSTPARRTSTGATCHAGLLDVATTRCDGAVRRPAGRLPERQISYPVPCGRPTARTWHGAGTR